MRSVCYTNRRRGIVDVNAEKKISSLGILFQEHGLNSSVSRELPSLGYVKCNSDYSVQNDESLRGTRNERKSQKARYESEKRCDLRRQQKTERGGSTQQRRAMEDCSASADKRLRQETLCRRQWTDEYTSNVQRR